MLQTVGSWVGRDLAQVERIVADVDDEDSLNAMCKRARVLINCVGPYALHGEPVVRAAIAQQCHHIDLSGEDVFLKSVAVNYDELAKSANVVVVGACGYDSAICDMGVEFLARNSLYLLNGVSCYAVMHMPSIEHNIGTFHSIIGSLGDMKKVSALDDRLFLEKMPTPTHKLSIFPPFFFKSGDFFSRWTAWLPAGDRDVARRTQYFHYTVERKRPIQVECYLSVERFSQIIGSFCALVNVSLFSLFSYGRDMLMKYPEVFTFGGFSSKGPCREDVLNRSFEMYFEGEAFDCRNDDSEEPSGEPTKKVSCRVQGPDAAYVTCAACLVQAAVVLVKEREKLPGPGVLTPGAAFSKTSYVNRLKNHGIKFEMI